MTTQELLREVLKDETLREKYGITEEELSAVSFDTTSKYPIIEALKTVIQLKDIGTPDTQVFKNIKTNQFNIH
ncbi:MAG: hypothetical protein K5850_05380 [Bacteroidales bacterium]|nr:hypothetical protein [Bacteroidales bacterium]